VEVQLGGIVSLCFEGLHLGDDALGTQFDHFLVAGGEVINATGFLQLILQCFTLLLNKAHLLFLPVKGKISHILVLPEWNI